jgi:hypothetical protein
MSVTVYKIIIAPSVYCEFLQDKPLTYATKEKAISAIKEAFEQKGMKFTIKELNNDTVFLNQSGGELARVQARHS